MQVYNNHKRKKYTKDRIISSCAFFLADAVDTKKRNSRRLSQGRVDDFGVSTASVEILITKLHDIASGNSISRRANIARAPVRPPQDVHRSRARFRITYRVNMLYPGRARSRRATNWRIKTSSKPNDASAFGASAASALTPHRKCEMHNR